MYIEAVPNRNSPPAILLRESYRDNGKVVPLPQDFFSTTYYTDRMLGYLKEHAGDGKPFFAYLAYTSPHWPLTSTGNTRSRSCTARSRAACSTTPSL